MRYFFDIVNEMWQHLEDLQTQRISLSQLLEHDVKTIQIARNTNGFLNQLYIFLLR